MNFGKFLLALLMGGFAFTGFAAMEFKEAEITTIKNMVEHNPGTGAFPAKVNEKIYEKSTVSTAAASMAELTFADTSITRMGANTQFSFRSKERLVKLEQGTILIHTPPGNGGAKVEAGGVTAAVSGTTFMASRDMSGNTMFVLLEGQGGLKVTVGGSSVVIRPGQAASVGADTAKEAATAPSDQRSGQPPAAAGGGEEKGKASGSSPSPTGGGGEGGGTPPNPTTPKIQVFDVDVKKVVSTTPLIVEFKNELPSAGKIEKTVELQQTAVKEGKLEKLEVEIVAVKNKDGDLLVGAPRVEREEMIVVNKQVDLVGTGKSGDGLDIDTAAGPGTPPPPTTTTAQSLSSPSPPPPSSPVTPTTVVGQIASSTTTTVQLSPSRLDVSVSGGLVQASLDRATAVGRTVSFSLPGLPWLTFSPSTVPIAAGAASTGPLAMALGNAMAYFPGWDASYGLRPIQLLASSGDLTDSVFTADLWPKAAIETANPIRQMLNPPPSTAAMAAFGAFFYFQARAPGITDGPSQYFASLASTTLTLDQIRLNPSGNALNLYSGQDFDFFAADSLTAATGLVYFTHVPGGTSSPGMLANPSTVMYGRAVSWNSAGTLWRGLADPLLDSTSLGFRATSLNADYWTFDGANPSLGNFGFWDDASNLSALQSAGGTPQSIQLVLSGLNDFVLAGGTGGVEISGLDLNTGGAPFEVQSLGDLKLKTSRIIVGTGTEVRLDSAGKVKLGAAAVSGTAPTAAQAEAEQVRIQATMPGGIVPNLAILRTADSFEMRNVSISGFSRVQLDGVSAPGSAGNRSVTGRVLLNASAVMSAGATAHLKIREMVGAAVNADSKIQMMALDDTGQLNGTLVAGLENSVDRVRLPVAGAVDSASGTYIDTHAVDLAARRIEFQNLNLAAMNSITARANTILVQNSFMTVVQSGGFINMYVQSGQVNPVWNSVVDGKLNFLGSNGFSIGGNNFNVSSQTELNNQLGVNILESGQHLGTPQAGKLNVFSL